jgi:hypothetical protein
VNTYFTKNGKKGANNLISKLGIMSANNMAPVDIYVQFRSLLFEPYKKSLIFLILKNVIKNLLIWNHIYPIDVSFVALSW